MVLYLLAKLITKYPLLKLSHIYQLILVATHLAIVESLHHKAQPEVLIYACKRDTMELCHSSLAIWVSTRLDENSYDNKHIEI